MTKENMRLIKEGLTFSEAIGCIQSGEKGIFIKRDAPLWGDSYLGMFPDYFGGSGKLWLSSVNYCDLFGIYIYAGGGSCRRFSEDDVFAKDWKVYKYEGRDL